MAWRVLHAGAMYTTPEHQPSRPPPPPFFAPSYAPTATPVVQRAASTALRSQVAGVVLFAAAGLLLVAALTKSWFVAAHGDGGAGLIGLESCRGAVCRSITWFDVRRIPAQIPIFATTALITTVALVAFSLHSAVVLVRRRPHAVKLRWLSQLIGLACFGIATFLFSLSIGDWSRGLAYGWSAFAGVAGVIATALVAGLMVRPLTR